MMKPAAGFSARPIIVRVRPAERTFLKQPRGQSVRSLMCGWRLPKSSAPPFLASLWFCPPDPPPDLRFAGGMLPQMQTEPQFLEKETDCS